VSSDRSDQQPTPTGESRLALVRRARRILRTLEQTYPDARCELEFADAFQLLCATVLSAQCTDVRVNSVTKELFRRFPDAESLAAAEPAEVESIIRPTGFFRAKAANLLGLAQSLVTDYDGVVPDRLTDLVVLPGVGRKTANVVLGNAFDIPGITVDTHVGRLSRRMGFTDHEDPVKAEQDLMAIFPRKTWTQMSHVMIWHGRRCCHSRRPACGACPVVQWCPGAGIGPMDPEEAAKLLKGPQ